LGHIVAYFQENLKRASGIFRKNIENLPCSFHNVRLQRGILQEKKGSRIDCPKGAGLYRCLSPGAWKKVAVYPFNQSLMFPKYPTDHDAAHEHHDMEPHTVAKANATLSIYVTSAGQTGK